MNNSRKPHNYPNRILMITIALNALFERDNECPFKIIRNAFQIKVSLIIRPNNPRDVSIGTIYLVIYPIFTNTHIQDVIMANINYEIMR